MSPVPVGKLPLTPAGAVDDQLNWVFATAEVIGIISVVSPLHIV